MPKREGCRYASLVMSMSQGTLVRSGQSETKEENQFLDKLIIDF